MLLIDYGFPAASSISATQPGTLMAHYRHRALADPLIFLPGRPHHARRLQPSRALPGVDGRRRLRHAGAFLVNCGVLDLLGQPASPPPPYCEAGAVQLLVPGNGRARQGARADGRDRSSAAGFAPAIGRTGLRRTAGYASSRGAKRFYDGRRAHFLDVVRGRQLGVAHRVHHAQESERRVVVARNWCQVSAGICTRSCSRSS